MQTNRYAIRVYDGRYGFSNYDDYVYTLPEAQVNKSDIMVERFAETKADIIKHWSTLISKYEGFTYCVKDIEKDHVIVGGVFDPDDIEVLENY